MSGCSDQSGALGQFILHRLLFSRQIAEEYSTGRGFRNGNKYMHVAATCISSAVHLYVSYSKFL